MGFRELTQRVVEGHVLYSALFELTYRCNLDCYFCYNDLGLAGTPLELDDYERILRELAELQVFDLSLTGGEPLASPVFWPVGRLARELGFVVRIKTNGHAVRGGIARRIKEEIDPFLLEVSLHGSSAETHDRQTRVPGSFERLLANLGEMRELGLRLRVNSTLTGWNEAEVGGMFDIADGLGIPIFFDPVVTPRDDGDREPLSISPSAQGVEGLFTQLRDRQQARLEEGRSTPPEAGRHNDVDAPGGVGKKLCGTGSSTIAVDPFGSVFPCVQWRRPVGNLHHQTVREIWFGSRELDEIRSIAEQAGEMMDVLGPDGRDAGFCIGLAAQLGDPLDLYPDVERRLETMRQVAGPKGKSRLPIIGQ